MGGVAGFAFGLALVAGAPLAAQMPAAPGDADYRPLDRAEAKLGRLLFYDPVLSGNRNIACATCHHPRFATSDGVSLGIGEGGTGLGPERRAVPGNRPEARIPRNAQALFNLGAKEFTRLFHDGRIEEDARRPSGFRTPLGGDMPAGFDGVLAAQAMFPVVGQDEMAGHYSENPVAAAARRGRLTGEGGAWDLLADRVAAIPAYAGRFRAVYPEIAAGRAIAFTDIANAVAAFVAYEWRSDTSPFDAHLRGEAPLTGAAARGMELFYGKAGCSGCHSGKFQTDHDFHAMGMPQLGPGKTARFERHARDTGRFRVTGRAEDRYRFRTPSLRNVAETGPYGHSGAYRDLRVFLKAHAAPREAVAGYDRAQAVLPELAGVEDWRILDAPAQAGEIAAAAERVDAALTPGDIEALLAFLGALSDPAALGGRLGVPERVPSGLAVPH